MNRSWTIHFLRVGGTVVVAIACLLGFASVAAAQYDFDQAPINYSQAAASDPVAKLQKRLLAGKASLVRDGERGYLTSLLKELAIPVSSQTLVFSKTSLQREAIGPQTPRAIYFDDETYVGYVQGGEVLEIAATDPAVGPLFYTIEQDRKGKARIVRQTDSCLQCHAGSMTRDLPGLMMRSVFTDPRGQPILSAGTKLTTHESPMNQRFGGWYVTGRHGDYDTQRHLGNLIGKGRDDPDPADPKAGANLGDLAQLFDTSAYPMPGSDIVALMVLAHQVEAHNLITRAGYACKFALRDARAMNQALGRPADELSEGTTRRIQNAAENLVRYLFFCDEAPLAAPISGTTTFSDDFTARGPRDSKGRSLRDLDLQTRLFKYPLSYLIYSDGFAGLPQQTKDHVYQRLFDVLTGKVTDKAFGHLSPDVRQAIREILVETKSDLPSYWK